MIIPRFNYSYTLNDAVVSLASLFDKKDESVPILNELFPDSQLFLINSARQGIKLILESFGLRPGAKVGVQPYTCSSVPAAITEAGFSPIFIDVNKNLTLDCQDLAKKIDQLDALIVTHTFGFSADIDKIKQLLPPGLPVLEDCAHALFSQYKHRLLGTFFNASVFSFGNGKFPSLGSGGLIVNNHKTSGHIIAEKVAQLPSPTTSKEICQIIKTYGKSLANTQLIQLLLKLFINEKYLNNRNKDIIVYGRDEMSIYKSVKKQLNKKIKEHYYFSKKQNENGIYLSENINKNYHSYLQSNNHFSNYFSFVLIETNRDSLYQYMKYNNIICGKHFRYAAHWASCYGYRKGDCPTFESLIDKILTIPCYYSLRKPELDKIITHLTEFKTIARNESYSG